MKKILLLLLAIIVVSPLFSQQVESKVDFKNGTLNEAIQMAKEKNLMVFCNFSANWCRPCKTLYANVYCDREVGDFMNRKFISLYINSESKEWSNIAREMKIKSYPTMIVLDTAGKEKFRMSGALTKNEFLSEMNKNIDEKRSPEMLKKRYESGERTPQLIYDYAYLNMVKGDEDTGYKIVNDYFNTLSENQKVSKDNWFLYSIFAITLSDQKAQYFVDNYKKFYAANDKKEVDDLAYKFLRVEILGYVSGYLNRNNLFNQKEFESVVKKINKTNLAVKPELLSIMKVAKARIKCEMNEGDNFESFINVCQKEFNHLSKISCFTMVSNFSNLVLLASDNAKKEAVILIEKYKSIYEKDGIKGVDMLERVIKSLAPIERGEAIAFRSISFDEAIQQAEKENKLLFIDCYTGWCGPCKEMAATVFTATIIKEYFDKNFVTLKMDMEKGEGPEIAKKYKVKGYPTLLLIDGKGNLIHQKLGSNDVQTFLSEFKTLNEKYHSK